MLGARPHNKVAGHDDIIFLAGSFDIGNYMSHDVTVPYGKALFFPLINAINSFSEDPEMKTKEDLIKWSKKDIEIIAYAFDYADLLIFTFNRALLFCSVSSL